MNWLRNPTKKPQVFPKVEDRSTTYSVGCQLNDTIIVDLGIHHNVSVWSIPSYFNQGYVAASNTTTTLPLLSAIEPANLHENIILNNETLDYQFKPPVEIKCWRVISQQVRIIPLDADSYCVWRAQRYDTRDWTGTVHDDKSIYHYFNCENNSNSPSFSSGTENDLKNAYFQNHLNHSHWPWLCLCCLDVCKDKDSDDVLHILANPDDHPGQDAGYDGDDDSVSGDDGMASDDSLSTQNSDTDVGRLPNKYPKIDEEKDTDGDGQVDTVDADDNNDGIEEITDDPGSGPDKRPLDEQIEEDNIEPPPPKRPRPGENVDTDGDGQVDAMDADDDNDNIPDVTDTTPTGGGNEQIVTDEDEMTVTNMIDDNEIIGDGTNASDSPPLDVTDFEVIPIFGRKPPNRPEELVQPIVEITEPTNVALTEDTVLSKHEFPDPEDPGVYTPEPDPPRLCPSTRPVSAYTTEQLTLAEKNKWKVDLINWFRAKRGVEPLTHSPLMSVEIAQKWADASLAAGDIKTITQTHNIPGYPGGGDSPSRTTNAGLDPYYRNENVASGTENEALYSLLCDAAHFDQLMDPKQKFIGFGSAQNDFGTTGVTWAVLSSGVPNNPEPNLPLPKPKLDVKTTWDNIIASGATFPLAPDGSCLPADWITWSDEDIKAFLAYAHHQPQINGVWNGHTSKTDVPNKSMWHFVTDENTHTYTQYPVPYDHLNPSASALNHPLSKEKCFNHMGITPNDLWGMPTPRPVGFFPWYGVPVPGPNLAKTKDKVLPKINSLPSNAVQPQDNYRNPSVCNKLTQNLPVGEDAPPYPYGLTDSTEGQTFYKDEDTQTRSIVDQRISTQMDIQYSGFQTPPTPVLIPSLNNQKTRSRAGTDELYENWGETVYEMAITYDVENMLDPFQLPFETKENYIAYEWYVFHRQTDHVNNYTGLPQNQIPRDKTHFLRNDLSSWKTVPTFTKDTIFPFPPSLKGQAGTLEETLLKIRAARTSRSFSAPPKYTFSPSIYTPYSFAYDYPIPTIIEKFPPNEWFTFWNYRPYQYLQKYAQTFAKRFNLQIHDYTLQLFEKYHELVNLPWNWPDDFNHINIENGIPTSIRSYAVEFINFYGLPPEYENVSAFEIYIDTLWFKYKHVRTDFKGPFDPKQFPPLKWKFSPLNKWPTPMTLKEIIVWGQSGTYFNNTFGNTTTDQYTGLTKALISIYFWKLPFFRANQEVDYNNVFFKDYSNYHDKYEKYLHESVLRELGNQWRKPSGPPITTTTTTYTNVGVWPPRPPPILSVATPETFTPLFTPQAEITKFQSFLTSINADRVALGLVPVEWNEYLMVAAIRHSYDMWIRNYRAHSAPAPAPYGEFVRDRIEAANFCIANRNENWTSAANHTDAYTNWKNSPPHWDNMMWPSGRSIGLGIVNGAATLVMSSSKQDTPGCATGPVPLITEGGTTTPAQVGGIPINPCVKFREWDENVGVYLGIDMGIHNSLLDEVKYRMEYRSKWTLFTQDICYQTTHRNHFPGREFVHLYPWLWAMRNKDKTAAFSQHNELFKDQWDNWYIYKLAHDDMVANPNIIDPITNQPFRNFDEYFVQLYAKMIYWSWKNHKYVPQIDLTDLFSYYPNPPPNSTADPTAWENIANWWPKPLNKYAAETGPPPVLAQGRPPRLPDTVNFPPIIPNQDNQYNYMGQAPSLQQIADIWNGIGHHANKINKAFFNNNSSNFNRYMLNWYYKHNANRQNGNGEIPQWQDRTSLLPNDWETPENLPKWTGAQLGSSADIDYSYNTLRNLDALPNIYTECAPYNTVTTTTLSGGVSARPKPVLYSAPPKKAINHNEIRRQDEFLVVPRNSLSCKPGCLLTNSIYDFYDTIRILLQGEGRFAITFTTNREYQPTEGSLLDQFSTLNLKTSATYLNEAKEEVRQAQPLPAVTYLKQKRHKYVQA